jgi:hypothetical protein
MTTEINFTFHILLLVGRTEEFTHRFKLPVGSSEYYEKETDLVEVALKTIPGIKFINEEKKDKDQDNIKVKKYQKWGAASFPLKVDGEEKETTFEVEYYKSRIYIKATIKAHNTHFKELFQEVRDLWERVEKAWRPHYHKMETSDTVLKFFQFPLIEIGKYYDPAHYNQLGNEARTTFFFEVNDPYSSFFKSRSVLIRFGRPSIIVSKMSPHSINNFMNAIYHSCLDRMRKISDEREKRGESAPGYTARLDYDGYIDAREFVETIFYDTQAAVSQIFESRYLFILSLIIGVAAFSGILGLMYILPSYTGTLPFTNTTYSPTYEYVRSVFGIGLLCVIIVLLFLLLNVYWRFKSRQ